MMAAGGGKKPRYGNAKTEIIEPDAAATHEQPKPCMLILASKRHALEGGNHELDALNTPSNDEG